MFGTRPRFKCKHRETSLRPAGGPARLPGPSVRPGACASRRLAGLAGARLADSRRCVLFPGLAWLSFQAHTVCKQGQEEVCGSDRAQRVEKWHSVNCTIASNREDITVAAELTWNASRQLLRDVSELQILGEISFNKSLYEGLNAESHRTKITVIFLKEKYYLPVIIGSVLGGLLALIMITVILFKCGFFKRKYQHLNLDNTRKAQLKSENLLTEEN